MTIQICVGSSCHLKGSEQLVDLLDERIRQEHRENEILLTGCFCTGRCTRDGVTVVVDDEIVTGVTPERFEEFYTEKILPRLK